MHKVKAWNIINGYHITMDFVGNPSQVIRVMWHYLRSMIEEARDVIAEDDDSWNDEFWVVRVLD